MCCLCLRGLRSPCKRLHPVRQIPCSPAASFPGRQPCVGSSRNMPKHSASQRLVVKIDQNVKSYWKTHSTVDMSGDMRHTVTTASSPVGEWAINPPLVQVRTANSEGVRDDTICEASLPQAPTLDRLQQSKRALSSPAHQYLAHSDLGKVQARTPWTKPSTLHGLVRTELLSPC